MVTIDNLEEEIELRRLLALKLQWRCLGPANAKTTPKKNESKMRLSESTRHVLCIVVEQDTISVGSPL